MATNKTFNCDICSTNSIVDGITLVYEHDMSGNHRSSLLLKQCVVGLHDAKDAPKVDHMCSYCLDKIKNPINVKKSRL